MIKLEAAHIEEMRGIRKLDLTFGGGKFAISGPNGSGKSGVIDAIEFGLTGRISRLTGSGTKGLTLSEHGPHVDKTKFPDAAYVQLDVFIPALKKSAKITRKVSAPSKPKIEPNDADVASVFSRMADHPEITLSRRDVLRFILVEPTKRSDEIQTLLKLDEIGQTRSALNTAQNRLQQEQRQCAGAVTTARDSLRLHLQTTSLDAAEFLEAVNRRRTILGLEAIAELGADTKVDEGLAGKAEAATFNKESALRDLKSFASSINAEFPELGKAAAETIVSEFEKLEADPELFQALQRRAFIEKGLDLVDGPAFPLCDKDWDDEAHLREHLRQKLAKSDAAENIQRSLSKSGAEISECSAKVVSMLSTVERHAQAISEAEFVKKSATWRTDLEGLKGKVATLEGLAELKVRIAAGWLSVPSDFAERLAGLIKTVEAKPDQTATVDAQTFLTTAQIRLSDYRTARKKSAAAESAFKAGKAVYDVYCEVMQEKLDKLYESVQDDFSEFYREINGDDESEFSAKLTPTAGRLDLDVNFYERGLYPPAAYHSEGHQDGMGVCLYLALMKRLFGDEFTFALLDDVVMSVDAGHRYEFCKLLKTKFPDTQFIITTHDRLWAEQMKSAGLVNSKTSVAFHSWTVETGPLVESSAEIWEDISASLAKGKVETAAASLRRHVEYSARVLADQIGAAPTFRADNNYDLGDLLPPVIGRMKKLYGKAADAAQSWGNTTAKELIAKKKTHFSSCALARDEEQWAVNKAVHFNEWANFGKKDFEPVVQAFKELLDCFRCDDCKAWIYLSPPRGNLESLRCPCNGINLNFTLKPKS